MTTMDNRARVNESYEFLQIIKDFDNALQIFREAFQNSYDNLADTIICKVYTEKSFSGEDLIIDIIDNGMGLEWDMVHHFFNLADSTKVDQNLIKDIKKLGYKGHGSKIFFNSEKVIIGSKPIDNQNDIWAVVCENPIKQLKENKELCYSGILNLNDLGINFPEKCKDSGFFLRIINPLYFKTKSTWYKLNHLSLRDYIKWFTIFGAITPELEQKSYPNELYLRGLDFGEFRLNYGSKPIIDPKPEYSDIGYDKFEIFSLGHYFPPECSDAKKLKLIAEQANAGKSPMEYYSHRIKSIKNPITCLNTVKFNLIIHLEGYETKRIYNLCLKSRGKGANTEIHYTDETRYGLWACKDGVPIERIDDWIKGGKGRYSYMHGFLDCDSFELTANRGSIRNTDSEILDSIKVRLNAVLEESSVAKELKEREDEQKREKRENKAATDKENLKKRLNKAQYRKKIILPDGTELKVPSKLSNGKFYSESETLILLIQLINKYPGLFPFEILDYNTADGIDFLVLHNSVPKYIELKGSLRCDINHPFEVVSKFVCYTISKEISNNSKISDIEDNIAHFRVCKNDKFRSYITQYDGASFTGYKIEPITASIESMEVIALDKVITEVMGGKII